MLYYSMTKKQEKPDLNLNEVLSENEMLRIENQRLKEEIAWFRKQLFGPKSEKLSDIPLDAPLLTGFDFADEVIVEEKKEHISFDCKKPSKKGSFTLELPDNMEVRETIHELPEDKLIDEATGEELVEIGRETVDKLASSSVRHYIKRDIYVKYAVRNNPLSGVIQLPVADRVLKGSKFDESFIAEVVTAKLAYHLPF